MPQTMHVHFTSSTMERFLIATSGKDGGALELLDDMQQRVRAFNGHFTITRQEEIRRIIRYATKHAGGGWEDKFKLLLANATITGVDDEPVQQELL